MSVSNYETWPLWCTYVTGSMWAQDEIESADRLIDFFERALSILDIALDCSHKARCTTKRASHTFTHWSKLIGQTARVRAKLMDPKWYGQSMEIARLQREKAMQENLDATGRERIENSYGSGVSSQQKHSIDHSGKGLACEKNNLVQSDKRVYSQPQLPPQKAQRKRRLFNEPLPCAKKNALAPVARAPQKPLKQHFPGPRPVPKKISRISRAPVDAGATASRVLQKPNCAPVRRQAPRPWRQPVHVRPPKTLSRDPVRRLSKLSSIPE